MENIASRIIGKFGGVGAVASVVGLNRSTVHRWTYPKEIGGTDGLVPAQHQQTLINAARERGINLTPNDFFLEPEPKP